MSEDKTLREIAISDDAFTKLPEGFREGLEKNEKVELKVVPKDKIRGIKALAMLGMAKVLVNESQTTDMLLDDIKEELAREDLPPLVDAKYFADDAYKQNKPYVPRVIGHPDTQKKGSR